MRSEPEKLRPVRGNGRRGFTLVELLVVLSVIGLTLAIAMPGIMKIFASGADAQAYNVLRAQLAAARALAIQHTTYAAVHVQMADEDENPDQAGTCFIAVMWDDPLDDATNGRDFVPAIRVGYKPVQLPGTMAFGHLTEGETYDSSGYTIPADTNEFTTFNVIFTPAGQLDFQAYDANIQFCNRAGETSIDGIFRDSGNFKAIWNGSYANNKPGVFNIVLFDYEQFFGRGDRDAYLQTNGRLIPLNRYTGTMLATD